MIPSRTTVLLDDGLDADCVCHAILASADAYDEDIYDGPLRAVIRMMDAAYDLSDGRVGVDQALKLLAEAVTADSEAAGCSVASNYLRALSEDASSGAVLLDYDTGCVIRAASASELRASVAAAQSDGGDGVIEVEGRRCYVAD